MSTETLTISQALRKVKQLKGKLGELQERAKASTTYPTDEQPAFGYQSTVDAISDTRAALLDLTTAVHKANANTMIDVDGKRVSLAYAIKYLAEIKSEIAWTKSLHSRAREQTSELAWGVNPQGERVQIARAITCHMPEARKAQIVDNLNARFSALNDLVETANHKTQAVGPNSDR